MMNKLFFKFRLRYIFVSKKANQFYHEDIFIKKLKIRCDNYNQFVTSCILNSGKNLTIFERHFLVYLFNE